MLSKSDQAAPVIIWCDCEMSGLNPEVNQLLEIALIPTNWELESLDPGLEIIVRPNQLPLVDLDPIVDEMHRENGLLDLLASGISLKEADARIMDYLAEFDVLPEQTILAGNTISSDRKFIDKFLPRMAGLLHFRMLDVSTVKLLAIAWFPEVWAQLKKTGQHRALGDVQASIEELKFYRERLFA
jgi:oligoribonuclease